MGADRIRRVLELPHVSLARLLPRRPLGTTPLLGIRVTTLEELTGLGPNSVGEVKDKRPVVRRSPPPYSSIEVIPETGGCWVIVTAARHALEKATYDLVPGGGQVPGVLELCLPDSPVRYVPLTGVPNPVVADHYRNLTTGVLSLYIKEGNAEK